MSSPLGEQKGGFVCNKHTQNSMAADESCHAESL